MNTYFFRKVAGSCVMLFVLMTLLFFLLRLAPGGPFDGEKNFPEEVMNSIRETYGLNRPLFEQYFLWISRVFRGDFGESFQYLGRPVTELIGESLGPSFLLGALSFLLSFGVGISAGVIGLRSQGSLLGNGIDRLFFFLAQAGLSIPSYLIASLLVVVFALKLDWLPPALWDGPSSWVLPIITLSIRPMSLVFSLTRSELIEQFQNDYIRTAFSKGLSKRAVFFKHALKNSLIPVITYSGPILANLITGSFLVELVFQIPGLGKYFVSAILNRDYPVVLGVTLFYGVILISSNLLSDVVCGILDPRMQESEKSGGVK
jgi:oligopeptide transport system permease protein